MSDVHFMLHDWSLPPMSTYGTVCAGHEGSGVIVKVGDRVRNLKVGQRAGIKPIWDTCGICNQCKNGRDNYCPKSLFTGLHVDGKSSSYRCTCVPGYLVGVAPSIMLLLTLGIARLIQAIRYCPRKIHHNHSRRRR